MSGTRKLRFDDWMRFALHDPQHGYYARKIRAVGAKGDFTTVPMKSLFLGNAIAVWLRSQFRPLRRYDVIEIGPGEGVLAQQILRCFPWWSRWQIRLHLVDSSAPLRKRQIALLGKKIRSHESMSAALQACRGKAMIYSNELVDAFEVRRFQKTEQAWLELWMIQSADSSWTEDWRPLPLLPSSSQFDTEFPVGQIIEVHESYHTWLKNWLSEWKSGAMLTIDYGHPDTRQLYHRRPNGTLRSYFLHQRIEGPTVYQNVGHQDVTADVNFTDLTLLAPDELPTVASSSLGDFVAQYHAEFSNTQFQEIGAAFWVLEQKRNAVETR